MAKTLVNSGEERGLHHLPHGPDSVALEPKFTSTVKRACSPDPQRDSRAVPNTYGGPTMLDPRPAAVAMLAGVLLVGCGQDKVEYQARTAPSGVQAAMPPVPNVPQKPIKAGDAYTVWGASYHLRSRVHHKDVAGKPLKLTGYITKTNLENAPECAVHETGKEDPEGCTPPVPAFWLGDTKDASDKDAIKVM